MGENQQTVQRLESLYITINRIIKGGLTFKVNSVKICKEIKVNLPLQHIRKVAAQYIHEHIKTRKCSALIDQLIIPKRESSHIYVKQPQMTTYSASLDKSIDLYNHLPAKTKTMTVRQFKKYCKKHDV